MASIAQISVRLGGSIFCFRAWQDSGTDRADPEQDRPMQRQDQDGAWARTRCSTRKAGHVRGGGSPSRTCAGRVQRVPRVLLRYCTELQ